MIPSAPIYRISFFLAKILGEDVETPTPTYREEFYLAKILGEDVELPEPVSRLDYYLAKIAGMDVEIPTPQYRAELYLAKIAGMEVELPLAISRLDQYLVEWAGTPQGEAVTVTGVSPLLLESAMEAELISLIQSGKVSQASTPSGSYVPIVCNNGEIKWDSVNERVYADGTPETITLGAQTASAESLYAVGDYADEQEIISGAVTRKVGVLVLDGTENWGAGSAGTGYRKFSLEIPDMIPDGGAAVSGLCSHYKWEYANVVGNFYFASSGSVLQIVEESSKSLSAFKSFLAAQYAAGTPVIVLYPLAESTTEQTAPQTLATVTGDNTLTVTANVSDIPISVMYMRANS